MNELLTISELAEYYGVTRFTVYNWVKRGMPFRTTPSGTKRFNLVDVATWCDDQAKNYK